MKNRLNKKVLAKEVRMQTETVFTTDGRIYTNPCPFESQEVHPLDGPLRQRGSCSVMPDGAVTFRPYKSTGRKKYRTAFEGESSQIRVYKHYAEARIRFPYDCTASQSISYIEQQLAILKKHYPTDLNTADE